MQIKGGATVTEKMKKPRGYLLRVKNQVSFSCNSVDEVQDIHRQDFSYSLIICNRNERNHLMAQENNILNVTDQLHGNTAQ